MLTSSLLETTETVWVDLLGQGDIAELRARKARKMGVAPSPQAEPGSRAAARKYIIVTYVSEFDKVHYPLMLEKVGHAGGGGGSAGGYGAAAASTSTATAAAAAAPHHHHHHHHNPVAPPPPPQAGESPSRRADVERAMREASELQRQVRELRERGVLAVQTAAQAEQAEQALARLTAKHEALKARLKECEAGRDAERDAHAREVRRLQAEAQAAREHEARLRQQVAGLTTKLELEGDPAKEAKVLRRDLAQVQAELAAEREARRAANLKHSREVERLEGELSKARAMEKQLRVRNRDLTAELSTAGRRSVTGSSSAAARGRSSSSHSDAGSDRSAGSSSRRYRRPSPGPRAAPSSSSGAGAPRAPRPNALAPTTTTTTASSSSSTLARGRARPVSPGLLRPTSASSARQREKSPASNAGLRSPVASPSSAAQRPGSAPGSNGSRAGARQGGRKVVGRDLSMYLGDSSDDDVVVAKPVRSSGAAQLSPSRPETYDWIGARLDMVMGVLKGAQH
jgi:hypothetical protein